MDLSLARREGIMAEKRYAVLRHGGGTEKAHSLKDVRRMSDHNDRSNTWRADNIDPARSNLNQVLIGSGDGERDVRELLDGHGLMKDGKEPDKRVIAHEVVLSCSKEAWAGWSPEERQAWIDAQPEFLRREFEGDKVRRVASAWAHLDEETGHVHAFVVPVVERAATIRGGLPKDPDKRAVEIARREAAKAGGAKRKDLCDEEVIAGFRSQATKGLGKEERRRIRSEEMALASKNLSDRQTRYAEAMAPFGLERGMEGSQAKHERASKARAREIELERQAAEKKAKEEQIRHDKLQFEASRQAREEMTRLLEQTAQAERDEAKAAKAEAEKERAAAGADRIEAGLDRNQAAAELERAEAAKLEAERRKALAGDAANLTDFRASAGYREALRRAAAFSKAAEVDLLHDTPSDWTRTSLASFDEARTVAGVGPKVIFRDLAAAHQCADTDERLDAANAWRRMEYNETCARWLEAKAPRTAFAVGEAMKAYAEQAQAAGVPGRFPNDKQKAAAAALGNVVGAIQAEAADANDNEIQNGIRGWLRRRLPKTMDREGLAGAHDRFSTWARDRWKSFKELAGFGKETRDGPVPDDLLGMARLATRFERTDPTSGPETHAELVRLAARLEPGKNAEERAAQAKRQSEKELPANALNELKIARAQAGMRADGSGPRPKPSETAKKQTETFRANCNARAEQAERRPPSPPERDRDRDRGRER